jgi:8-oxo-dGTP diphosphatase
MAGENLQCPKCGAIVKTFRNPFPTVDIIICVDHQIVLIERKNQPLGWALPGGFVDYGESLEDAARREAKEETGLDLVNLRQFRAYSEPEPRSASAQYIDGVYRRRQSGTLRGRRRRGAGRALRSRCPARAAVL